MPKLCDRIRQLRTEKNMTQAELAKHFGKSESAARMWELGKANPDVETIIALSKFFDCTTDYLLGVSEIQNVVRKDEFEERAEALFQNMWILNREARETILGVAEALDELFTFLPWEGGASSEQTRVGNAIGRVRKDFDPIIGMLSHLRGVGHTHFSLVDFIQLNDAFDIRKKQVSSEISDIIDIVRDYLFRCVPCDDIDRAGYLEYIQSDAPFSLPYISVGLTGSEIEQDNPIGTE